MAVREPPHPSLRNAAKLPSGDENSNLPVLQKAKPVTADNEGRQAHRAAAAAASAEQSARSALGGTSSHGSDGSLSAKQKERLAKRYNELFDSIDAEYSRLVEQGIEDGQEYGQLEKEITLAVEKLEDFRLSLLEETREASQASQGGSSEVPGQRPSPGVGAEAPIKGSGSAMPGQQNVVQQECPVVRGDVRTIIHAAGGGGSYSGMFGPKAHCAFMTHRLQHCLDMVSTILFSSISATLGQAGTGAMTSASCVLDGMAMWQNQQRLGHKAMTIQWGPVGDIGLRRAIFGSRDAFAAGMDLGQKLIYAGDAAQIMRVCLLGVGIPRGPVVNVNEEERVRQQYANPRKQMLSA